MASHDRCACRSRFGMENLVTTTGPYHRGAVRLGLDAAGGVDVGQPVGPL